MKLTFHDQNFILSSMAETFMGSPKWQRIKNDTFRTKDINEAARFRQYADGIAERIFSKLMLKNYIVPSGGILVPPHLKLMPFQEHQGIPHILKTSRTYIAHQPGLGKTAQAVCAVNTKPGRALVIVPSFLKTNWAREITQWSFKDFPEIAVVPEKSKSHLMNWNADWVICSDAVLDRPWVQEGLLKTEFRFIFIDEAHRFKTPEANRTISLFGGANAKVKSRGLIYDAEHVVALSGTPMLNRPFELWPIVYAMAPEVINFMSRMNFGFRYCGPRQDERGRYTFLGSTREEELNKKIMGHFMHRLRKDDVLKDLPDKIREIITVNDDTRAQEIKLLDRDVMRTFKFAKLGKPKDLGDYAKIRHANGLAKVKWATEFVFNYLQFDETEQIILFAHHRDVVDDLRKNLFMFQPVVINGGVSTERRTEIEDLFQSGKRRLIIGNLDAMNLGLTLTKATRVVFAEYAWTPALNEQAEDRAHRIGQKDSVYCQYLVLPNSIDELVLISILRKEKSINKVIG